MADTDRDRSTPHPLLVFLAIVVAIGAVLSFAVAHLAVDGFKPRIEAAFRRATGRALTIGGPLRLTLLPSPGIVADDVTVANGPGGSQPAMAHVRRLDAHVSLLPLLAGRVRVADLTLLDADILLERLPDGTPNWRFTPAPAAATPGNARPHRPHRFGFSLLALDGTGGTLRWHDRGELGTGALALDTFHAGRGGIPAVTTLYVGARHGATPVSLSLATGATPADLEGDRPLAAVTLRATLTVGTGANAAALSADGTLGGGSGDAPAGPRRGFDGIVRARIPALSVLNGLLPHADLPSSRDLDGVATVAVGPDGREILRTLTLGGNATDLGALRPGLALAHFAIDAPKPGAPASADAVGTLRGAPFAIHAASLPPVAVWTGTGTGPVRATASFGTDRVALDGTVARDGTRTGRFAGTVDLALPDPPALAPLLGHPVDWHRPLALAGALEARRGADGDAVRLDARSWSLDGRAMAPMAFAARLGGGSLVLDGSLPGANASFVDWRENLSRHPSPVSLRVAGNGLPARTLAWALLRQDGIGGRLDADATLAGRADGLTLDPSSLSGPLAATLLDADLDAETVRALLGPVLAAADAPAHALGAETLRCAGIAGRFDGGRLAVARLSLDSPLLVLNGHGTIDAADDTMALALVPVLRIGGIGASTTVALAGPIGAPSAGLAPGAGGRYTLAIGHDDATASCDASPDVGPAPARKAPRAVDILRGLGLLR